MGPWEACTVLITVHERACIEASVNRESCFHLGDLETAECCTVAHRSLKPEVMRTERPQHAAHFWASAEARPFGCVYPALLHTELRHAA